jgi:hypothetical protein
MNDLPLEEGVFGEPISSLLFRYTLQKKEVGMDKFYAQIGKLKVENEFLIKKLEITGL